MVYLTDNRIHTGISEVCFLDLAFISFQAIILPAQHESSTLFVIHMIKVIILNLHQTIYDNIFVVS